MTTRKIFSFPPLDPLPLKIRLVSTLSDPPTSGLVQGPTATERHGLNLDTFGECAEWANKHIFYV